MLLFGERFRLYVLFVHCEFYPTIFRLFASVFTLIFRNLLIEEAQTQTPLSKMCYMIEHWPRQKADHQTGHLFKWYLFCVLIVYAEYKKLSQWLSFGL